MKGTFFSADFIKDNNGNLRLLEMNTDTSVIAEQISNVNWQSLIDVISGSSITQFDVIYKTVIHENLVNNLLNELGTELPDLTINTYAEDQATIYPTSVDDADNKYILRLAYDESALFDSFYCKNRLNSYRLFISSSDSGSDFVAQHYFSSSADLHNTLEYVINPTNIPDVSVKDLDEQFNPIDFYKIGKSGETDQQRWNGLIEAVKGPDKLIEQYHYHESNVNDSGSLTSYRSFFIVHGTELDTINVLSYKNSALFDLPTDISSEVDDTVYANKLQDYHYYEYTTNAFKVDGAGLLSTDKIQMADGTYQELGQVQVGDSIKSFYVSGSPQVENDYDTLNWNYSGSQFPSGSYVTESQVVFKNTETLHYNGLVEYVVNGDSQFSGTSKQFLVFDSGSGLTGYKHASELDPTVDYFYDFQGNIIDLDEVNYYVTSDNNVSIVELDVENTDTYIISSSTAFNNVVSHNNPCFVAGTQVTMNDGSFKNIQDITIGEVVKTYNHNNGQIEDKEIINILHKQVDETVKFYFSDGKELQCTHDHPLYSLTNQKYVSYSPSLTKQWYGLEVDQAEVGTRIMLSDGSETTITSIEEKTDKVTVYNLQEVVDNHNFYANDMLVHNRCFVAGTKVTMADGSQKNIEDIEVGEIVQSYDFENNEYAWKAVLATNSFEPSLTVTYTVEFNDSELEQAQITCTYDHPIFKSDGTLISFEPADTNNKYVGLEAVKAQIGDEVKTIDGTGTITAIVEEISNPETLHETFIITVQDNENFFAENVLVHNK